MAAAAEDDLPDFDEEPLEEPEDAKEEKKEGEAKKGNFAAIHASGFRDFLLKPELLRAIVDCGVDGLKGLHWFRIPPCLGSASPVSCLTPRPHRLTA